MYRSHTCGELPYSDVNKQVTLAGWVQRSRKMGGMTFIDLRDRYGNYPISVQRRGECRTLRACQPLGP